MIFTVHAEIVYFLIGLIAIFAISDVYMFYLFATGGL
jgi:uncharacterized membrane protein YuzA (DUF378 family)